MADSLRALFLLSVLWVAVAAGAQAGNATEAIGASAVRTSVIPSQSEQANHHTADTIIPLLSQFTDLDPTEAETTDEAGGSRQKRTHFCKKCGYGGGFGGGHWGKYKRKYKMVRPRIMVVRPVYYPRVSYYRPRGNPCNPCSNRGYHPGGGGGNFAYAMSSSSSVAYSSGKRK